ncbi:MAG: outer membrane protein assembly factor BamA [Bacteroidales bacterium]|nr:outer membrane protein assembly factor BamA [Bacteroidales bacterium]
MNCHRPYLFRLLVTIVATLFGSAVVWAESPVGKVIARVIPVNNRVHNEELILSQMPNTRPGKVYDDGLVQQDVRQLLSTRWFAPGGVRVDTAIDADNQVTVFVHVIELNNIISEVVYVGAQHLSDKELNDLTGLRRGSPLNPTMNQLAANSILGKLREDGRYYASVTLLEGGKLTDSRVVFHIVEGPVVRVRNVSFRGNDTASSGRLRTVLTNTGALIPRVVTALSPKYMPQQIELDKSKVLDYYHRLGYLEARIEEEVVPHPDSLGVVDIVYHVQEGPAYSVRAVRIEGNKTYTETRLKKVVALQEGKRYDKDVVQADIGRLRTLYGNSGVSIGIEEGVFAVADQPGMVDVQYKVYEPGREPDRVGRIIIEGNTITDQRVILNQLQLYPGQILQYPQIERARGNLIRTGLFDGEDPPTVEVVPNDFDSAYKDIRVRVKETRTGMVALTANVNSDAGVNGSVTVNQRNFDITRLPTSFDDLWAGRAFRGGGQELRLEAMPGTIFQRYSLTFREPYLFDSRFGLTASGYYFNRAFAEYNEDRYGGRFTLDYRLDNPIWRVNASTRIEGVNVKDIPYWATPAITDDAGQSTILGVGTGLTRDTRDSYLLPTTGSVVDLKYEQVFGSYDFPIGTAEASLFRTLYQRKDGSGKHIVAARTQLGVTTSEAPVFERFYAGGFRSLRGFQFRGVGPFENYLNVGGTFSFLNSVEYQLPVMANDRLYLVGFVDHGTVEQDVRVTDYRVSVGFGARIVVPALGPLPIALDFAFPLVKGPYDNERLFSFYVGWFGGGT